MHILAAKPGTISDGGEAVDLGQAPAEIVVLSDAQATREPRAVDARDVIAHLRPPPAPPPPV